MGSGWIDAGLCSKFGALQKTSATTYDCYA